MNPPPRQPAAWRDTSQFRLFDSNWQPKSELPSRSSRLRVSEASYNDADRKNNPTQLVAIIHIALQLRLSIYMHLNNIISLQPLNEEKANGDAKRKTH
jgi:hypothetical protein